MKKHFYAFTLLEVIVVIIIVGVLTGLALPRMMKMIERSYGAEALTQMATIRSAIERCYIMRNGTYDGCNGYLCDKNAWQSMGLDPPCGPNYHFFYGIVGYAGEPDAVGITAWRTNVDCSAHCDFMVPVINMKIYPEYKITGWGAFKNI